MRIMENLNMITKGQERDLSPTSPPPRKNATACTGGARPRVGAAAVVRMRGGTLWRKTDSGQFGSTDGRPPRSAANRIAVVELARERPGGAVSRTRRGVGQVHRRARANGFANFPLPTRAPFPAGPVFFFLSFTFILLTKTVRTLCSPHWRSGDSSRSRDLVSDASGRHVPESDVNTVRVRPESGRPRA